MIYEFAATQDLHGYSKPWAPGAGKNKIEAIGEWNVGGDGTVTSETGYTAVIAKITQGDTYIFSKNGTAAIPQAMGYYSDYPDVGAESYDGQRVIPASATFTAPIDGYVLARMSNTKQTGYQVEEGSTASSYVPFENICPLSGYNIWDPLTEQMIQLYSGYVDAEARKLYLHPVYEEYDGEELVGPWMSSMDKYTEEGTPTTGAFVVDFGGELTEYDDITDFMLQTLLDSLGVRRFFASGAMLLNSLMDQAQGRVRSEEELLHLSRPLKVIAIGDQLPAGITIKPISKDVLPGLPGKFIR